MPPLRLAIIDDLAGNAESTTSDVQRRLNKPWKTVDRQLQSLNMLEVLDVVEKPWGEERHRWHYSLASLINPTALDPESLPNLESSPQKSVRTPNPHRKSDEKREEGTDTPRVVTDKSGEPQSEQSAPSGGSATSATSATNVQQPAGPCPLCNRPLARPSQSCSMRQYHGHEAS